MSHRIRICLAVIVGSGLILTGIFRTKTYRECRIIMGTMCEMSVHYRGKLPRDTIERAFNVIHTIDSLESRFLPESDVSRINRYEDFTPSIHTLRIVKEAIKIGDITGGAFDITCGPLMEVWKDFKEEVHPDKELIKRVRQLVDFRMIDTTEGMIRIRKDMKIDLSGLAKGYACDLAVETLKQSGLRAGFVNCGGDIKTFGDRMFNIGIRHPREKGIVYTLGVTDESIVTSGDYESYFESEGRRYHHVIDPSTGYPTDGCISVTIVAKDAMFADGLATGIMVMGIKQGDSLLHTLDGIRGLFFDLMEDSLVVAGNLMKELSSEFKP